MTVLFVKALSSGSNTVVFSPQFVTVARLLFFFVLSSVVMATASATAGTFGEVMLLAVISDEPAGAVGAAMLLAAMPDEPGIFLGVEGFSSSSLAEAEVRFLAAREF